MTDSKENKVNQILKEDKDNIIDRNEIDRIFKLYLNRIATPEEKDRFDGIHEDEKKILIDYCNMESDKLLNEEKGQMDAMKIGGDLANKEMKIKGDQSLGALKEIAAVPGMAGPVAGMPSVVPPMPQRPMIGGQGQGAQGQPAGNQKFLKDGKKFLVQFK